MRFAGYTQKSQFIDLSKEIYPICVFNQIYKTSLALFVVQLSNSRTFTIYISLPKSTYTDVTQYNETKRCQSGSDSDPYGYIYR